MDKNGQENGQYRVLRFFHQIKKKFHKMGYMYVKQIYQKSMVKFGMDLTSIFYVFFFIKKWGVFGIPRVPIRIDHIFEE